MEDKKPNIESEADFIKKLREQNKGKTSNELEPQNADRSIESNEETISSESSTRVEDIERSHFNSPQIENELKDRGTTFVFLWGTPNSGKTSLITSLIGYMSTTGGRFRTLNRRENLEATLFVKDITLVRKSGGFLPRTDQGTLTEIDMMYIPENNRTPMKLTFLEASGEDHVQVEISKKTEGKLPDKLDIYLECADLKLLFIIVVDQSKARQDGNEDLKIKDFLDYISDKDRENEKTGILVVLSKWDNYDGEKKNDAVGFMEKFLPVTYSEIANRGRGSVAHFSIGDVSLRRTNQFDKDGNLKMEEYIRKFDDERAFAVINWLYRKSTGRKIITKTFFEKLIDLIKMQ